MLGVLAAEKIVDGRGEDLEPSLEVLPRQLRLCMQIFVHEHRIPSVLLIRRSSEKQTLPEIADDRQMMFEIELGDIGEDVSDHVVAKRTLVEILHQPIDVGS